MRYLSPQSRVASIWHNEGSLWVSCPEDTLGKSRIANVPEKLLILPNPVRQGYFDVLMPEDPASDFQLVIYTIDGKYIANYIFEQELGNSVTIHADLPSGTYLIEIRSEQHHWDGKMVVVH